MKRAIALLLAIAAVFGLFEASADEIEYFIICNPKSHVNVNLSPKRGGEEIGRLEIGDKVYFDGKKKNGFYHCVGINNEWGEGWVWKGYLVEDEPTVNSCKATIVSNGKVFCRNYVNGSKHGSLKNGAEVNVLAYSDEWAVTNKGYIMTEYLKMWE